MSRLLSPPAPDVKGEFVQSHPGECRARDRSAYLIKMTLLTITANPLPSRGLRGFLAK